MEQLLSQPAAPPPFREFLYHARDQAPTALKIGGALVLLALGLAAVLPPSYRATATLAILPAPEFTVRAAAGSHDQTMSALALDQMMKAESALLESDSLHAQTLRAIGPATLYPSQFDTAPPSLLRRTLHDVASLLLSPWRVTPADRVAARLEAGLRLFRSSLDVIPSKDASDITLTFDNRSGAVAAATLNRLLTLYASQRSQLYRDPQLDIIRRNVAARRQAVAQADEMLAHFKQTHDISDYDLQRGLLLRRQSDARQALADARIAEQAARARVASLSQGLRGEPRMVGLYREQDADTRLQSVNAGLLGLRARLAAAQVKYRDTSRMVTTLRAQIAAGEAESGRLSHLSTISVMRDGRNPAIDPLNVDETVAAADEAAAAARLAATQDETQRITDAVRALDRDETDLAALQRQKASAEADFTEASRLLAERTLSEAEDARRMANIRVVQPALVPETPRKLPLMVIAAGLVLALFASLAWIVTAFMLRPVFLTGEGLYAATGLPVLAVFNRDLEREGVVL